MLRQQKVNRLAMLIYSTIEIPPLAFHCNIRLVHPPADPDRPLAAMKRLLQLRTVLNDPPIDCGVIPLHPPFLHEFFDVACAQWIRYIPANSHQNDLWGEMRSFETDRHVSLPHVVPLVMERDHTAKGLKEKLATKPFSVLQTILVWGLNPRHWLSAFFHACVAHGGKTRPDLSAFLPWQMTDERKHQLAQPLPVQRIAWDSLPPERAPPVVVAHTS